VYHTHDTIVAIASAPGGAARGVVRISGPAAVAIVSACFDPQPKRPLDTLRSATVLSGTFRLSGPHARNLPADVYLWPGRRSYTREPVAEIHTIGAPPMLSAVLNTLSAAGARPAEPGEFTLRAFLAGRLDLTQAEAVLGVIDARGEDDFRAALAQLAGGLAQPLNLLRGSLLDLLAELEAGLDFADEDIQFITASQIEAQLGRAAGILEGIGQQLAGRGRSDGTARSALVGWPNVGKSSLFNALSRHAAALVSSEPGTTRDYLIADLDLDGIACQLIDMAGVQPDDGGEPIARVAQQMTASQARGCDVRMLCLDSTRPLNSWEQRELAMNQAVEQVVVLTKCDGQRRVSLPCDAVETSALAAQGLDDLRHALRRAVARRAETAASLTAERCADSLRLASESLERAAELNRTSGGEELIAAEIRLGLNELGKIVGTIYTDDVLDRIFSRFCIGK
jgi:tRNA modification GTPase